MTNMSMSYSLFWEQSNRPLLQSKMYRLSLLTINNESFPHTFMRSEQKCCIFRQSKHTLVLGCVLGVIHDWSNILN
jgi:hypothetical protein